MPQDLNDPKQARAYLMALEHQGLLSFEGEQDSSQTLTDDEALDVASILFLRFNSIKKDGFIQ